VSIYCECECSEFKESVCNVKQNTADRRYTPTPNPSLPWPLLLPVAGVVAACCPLSLLLLPIADTSWCPLPVLAFACVVAVVADPTTHGE